MNRLINNIPSLAFLGLGVYLILHGHPEAGGWCIFGSLITVHVSAKQK
jgi:hypothetical protein